MATVQRNLRTVRSLLRSRIALLAVPAALVLLGAAMRIPVLLTYHGPFTAHGVDLAEMAHVGAYSDISHLYFRDHLWQHPMPYFDYRFEYPVLTGLFVWLASFRRPGPRRR
jgi:hypothetical protein